MRLGCFVLLLTAIAAGCAHRPPAMEEVPPPPAPPTTSAPAPIAAPTPPPPPYQPAPRDTLSLCGIRDGQLVLFQAEYVPETRDTLIGGRPYTQIFPLTGEYAEPAEWFVNSEMFTYFGACFGRYGIPYHLDDVRSLRRVGMYRGVPIFTDLPPEEDRPLVLYLPVRPCVFQTYSTELVLRPCGVRIC